MDWLDFEARPELAASSLDTVEVGCRRVRGSGVDELVTYLEQRGAGLEPQDYRVLLYVGGLPEPRASLPAAKRAWESRFSAGFHDGAPTSRRREIACSSCGPHSRRDRTSADEHLGRARRVAGPTGWMVCAAIASCSAGAR